MGALRGSHTTEAPLTLRNPMVALRFLMGLALIILLVPGAAFASVTKGTVKGTAVDEGGLPVPGVLITITAPELMGNRQAMTDGEGRYLFVELPPGTYQLVAQAEAFSTVRKTGLSVNIGRTLNIPVTMILSDAAEEIVIEQKQAAVDTEAGNRGTVLTKDFLDRIPTGRSYQEAVQMAAGVTGGSNPNVGGASYNENTYMLDGVNITDPVTGTFSLNFNFDAIEQIEVITSAFDPEYGINLGGAINVVTQTGTNTFEASIGVYHENGTWSPRQDWRWGADGQFLNYSDFGTIAERWQVGARISGPIIRDKAWFIAAYQYSRSRYAYLGVPLPRDFDGHYVLAKLTWQPTTDHRFTVLTQTNPTTIDNLYGSRFIKPEAQGRQAQGGFVTSVQWDWFISPQAFLETKTLVQKSYLEGYGVPCTHNEKLGYNSCEPDEFENTIDFVTPGRLGVNNAYDSGNEISYDFDDRWNLQLQSKFSLLQLDFLGSHDVKTGLDGSIYIWDRTFGRAGNLVYSDLNQISYDPDTLRNYYWNEFSGPFRFSTTAETLGLFIQDVWKPIDNLTFRYGTRYDRQVFRNDVGEPIVNTGLWGPRIVVNWDPWADGKTKLKAAYGRFNDQSRLAVASYLNASGMGSKLFLGEYFAGNGLGHTNGTDEAYTYNPIQNFNTALDGITAPRADVFEVGAEREVVQNLNVSLYFTGKYTKNLYAFDELNYIYSEDAYSVLGTNDGTRNYYNRLRTPDIARRNYYRTDLSFRKLPANRWSAMGTYSFTRSIGTVQNAPSGFLTVAPQVEYYENRLLGTDILHDITISGYWDIPNDPWTTQLGTTFLMESGYPVSRAYRAAGPNGSHYRSTIGGYARAKPWWTWNVMVAQKYPVKKGNLSTQLTLFNITNNRFGQSASLTADNRWAVVGKTQAMRMMLGVEYEF